MQIIEREHYLSKLRTAQETNLIKVITGVRRCGKSVIMRAFADELIDKFGNAHVYTANYEALFDSDEIQDHKIAYRTITKALDLKQQCFVLLDEVQNVAGFEYLVDQLFATPNVDLYITGSNAYLLSTDLATMFAGRYIEIKMYPYSFSEYVQAMRAIGNEDRKLLDDYITFGGLPESVNLRKISDELVHEYLSSVNKSIITKDVTFRHKLRDHSLLERVIKFLLSNIGSPVSPNRIAQNLSVEYRNTKSSTVDYILSALEQSFIFYQAERFDTKGRGILKTNSKFYPVDLGVRNAVLGKSSALDYGHQLEAVVYFELLRRGKNVYVGKVGDREVDFVMQNADGSLEYYQVAYTTMEESTLLREITPLQKIRDSYPKYILSTDSFESSEGGIMRRNVEKWLLGEGCPMDPRHKAKNDSSGVWIQE
ncbi:MAG: ATP-binding protein [Candidatus Ancillula sp.]|jgi:predicted AAA+ superfamily ATPase|nr:ATP-binding protein [Candidatus Ancillula sp.]